MTKRGKRRLVIVAGVVVTLMVLGGGALAVRAYLNERRIQQAREQGIEHFEAGRYREAVRALGAYFGRYPDDVEAALLLASARLKVPEPDGRQVRVAMAVFRSVIEREPNNMAALEGLLDIYRQVGRRVEMMDVAERIVEQSPQHELGLKSLIAGHLNTGAFELAKTRAAALTRVDPARYEFREIELQVLERAGADSPALQEYCNVLIRDAAAADGRWHVLRGRLRLQFQQIESGRADLMEAARLGVEQDLFEYLLWTLEAIGERESADALLADARQRRPDEWWPVEIAVRREWVHGRPDRAQEVLNEATGGTEREPSASMLRWQAMLAAVRLEVEAVQGLLDRLAQDSQSMEVDERDLTTAWVEVIKARLEASNGRWREASRAYDIAMGRLPSDMRLGKANIDVAVLYHLQGEALAMMGENTAALNAFRQAYEGTRQMWIVAGVHLGEALLRSGRLEEAFSTLVDMTRRTRPSVPGPYLAMGRVWLALERAALPIPESGRRLAWPDAMAYLKSLHESSGGLPDVLPMLAQAMLARNDVAGLAALLETAASRTDLSDTIRAQLAQVAADGRVEAPAALFANPATPEGAVDLAWARARALGHADRVEAGLAELDRLSDTLAESARMRWRLARLRYLEEMQHPAVREAVDELAAEPTLPLEALDVLLVLDTSWQRRDTLQNILAHLESSVPAGSSRLILAKAQAALRFEADDQQSLAAALADVDSLRERGGGDSVAVLTTMARLHLAIGPANRRVAAGLLRQAVERWPQQVSIYPQLIALLQELGEFSSAERYLRQFEAFRGSGSDVGRASASLFARQGDFEEAVARFDIVARESGDQADRLTLAAWRLRAGRYDEAWTLLQELVREKPCSPMAVLLAVQYQVSRGAWSQAEAILNDAALERESVRLLLWGAYHSQRGDEAEAERFLRQAAESDPENATTSVWLARHALVSGETDEAIRIASEALARHPDEADLRLLIASAALGGDESSRREALKTFEQLRGDNAPLVETVRLFSSIVSSDGTMSSKAEDLRAAADLASRHPTFLPASRLAITLHRIAGDMEGAARIAEQAMLRMPGEPEPARWLTELQIERGELEAAMISAEAWRRRSLADPFEASIVVASIALDLRNFDRARQVLAPLVERFRADRQRDPRGMERWVITLMLSGRVSEAYAEVDDVMREDEPTYLTWLRNAQTLSGDPAMAALTHAGEQAVTAERRLNLALAWATTGQRVAREPQGGARAAVCFTRAREAVEAVVAGAQPTPEALRTSAIITAAEGRTEEAVALYQDLLRRDPNDAIALNNLAMLLVTGTTRVEEALSLSGRLVSLHGDIPDFLDTHALVLLHADRLDDALRTIDSALNIRASSPALLLTRARILIRRGDSGAAREVVAHVERILRDVLVVPVEVGDALREVRESLRAGVRRTDRPWRAWAA